MGIPWLSVVIPAYDEEARLPQTLRAVIGHLRGMDRQFEVVVVDDGSRDRTVAAALAAGPSVRVLSLPHRGKGSAVRAGVLAAAGELILVTDADLSTPIAEVGRLCEAVEAGYGVAIGSRALAGSRIEVPQAIGRRVMGRTFNLLVRTLVLPDLRDTQCGAKLYRRDAALDVFGRCRTDGFAFDVEALCLATQLGYRVAEVPIAWRDSPGSRVRPLADSVGMLWELLCIRSRVRAARA